MQLAALEEEGRCPEGESEPRQVRSRADVRAGTERPRMNHEKPAGCRPRPPGGRRAEPWFQQSPEQGTQGKSAGQQADELLEPQRERTRARLGNPEQGPR